MADINARKAELYQGKPYGLDSAVDEALKIEKLVGGYATTKRYRLASNIITARLEDGEVYALTEYTIPKLEPLVQSAQLFNELMRGYLSSRQEITPQSPLNRNRVEAYVLDELDSKLFRDWDIVNHRERHTDYQRDLRLKRIQLAGTLKAFIETFSGGGDLFESKDDVLVAIELFNAENKQKLEEAHTRLKFLKDEGRVAARNELKALEGELAKEPALDWINGVISRIEGDESKRGIDNSHRWVTAMGADKWGRGFEARLCCTRCGMGFSRTPDGESRDDGELGYAAMKLSGETGRLHSWSRLFQTERNRGGGGRSYHEGMYRLVGVTPYDVLTTQTGRREIVQDQDGKLFSVQRRFEGGRTGKWGHQEITIFPVTREQVMEAIRGTAEYFPGYKDVVVLRDTSPLDLMSPPNGVLAKLAKREIREVELQLPLGLTLELAYRIIGDARKIKFDDTQPVDFEELADIGVPEEFFGTVGRYAKLILNQADSRLYDFQGEKRRFQGLNADCSSAVLVAILLHSGFRGPAEALFWLHPTVPELAGGGATFRPEGVGGYVFGPADLFGQLSFDADPGRGTRASTLVRETGDRLICIPNTAGLVIGYKGSGINLFQDRLSFVAGRRVEAEVITRDRIEGNP